MAKTMTGASALGRTAAALTEAYLLHHADLLAYAQRRLRGDASHAEDAVQETFLRAWRSLSRFDPSIGTMRMWLFAICRNATADAARIRSRHVRGDRVLAGGECAGADPAIDRLADRLHVDAALRPLPALQRDAIVEVHLRQRSYTDAARDLGVPVGTVKSRVHLGLRSARQALAA
jgi:RNA polymerase sigma-70 factor (ECF subfamily)